MSLCQVVTLTCASSVKMLTARTIAVMNSHRKPQTSPIGTLRHPWAVIKMIPFLLFKVITERGAASSRSPRLIEPRETNDVSFCSKQYRLFRQTSRQTPELRSNDSNDRLRPPATEAWCSAGPSRPIESIGSKLREHTATPRLLRGPPHS